MSDALEAQFRLWRVGAQLFGAFGMLALLITVLGVVLGIAATVALVARDTRRSVRGAPAGLRRGAGVPAGTRAPLPLVVPFSHPRVPTGP